MYSYTTNYIAYITLYINRCRPRGWNCYKQARTTHSTNTTNVCHARPQGWNYYKQARPPKAAQSEVVAIAAGHYHSLAVKADGSVIAWGGIAGEAEVPDDAMEGVVSVAAGRVASLAIKGDGSVVTWPVHDFSYLDR